MCCCPGTPAPSGRPVRLHSVVVAALLAAIVHAAAGSAVFAQDGASQRGAREAKAGSSRRSTPRAERPEIRVFDGFDGAPELDWKPVRPDPSLVSRDIWSNLRPLAKNLYVIDNPLPEEGDFVATTCLDGFKPVSRYQQAGLLVYDDDDDFLKWTCEFHRPEGRILIITREEAASPRARHVYGDFDVDRLWLRLIKRGRFYEIASSTDGETFTVHGEFVWGDGSAKQMGLMAMNGLTPEKTDAPFDFFEVRSLTAQEKDRKRLAERDRLWGIWVPAAASLSGKPLKEVPSSRFTFLDGSMRITEEGGSLEGEYSLDWTKQPKQLLLWVNRDAKTIVQRFAYSLKGDTLSVCFNPDPDAPAPTRLHTSEGDGLMLLSLKRIAGD
jgi:uncharacterized protein (TIGR03067 family)